MTREIASMRVIPWELEGAPSDTYGVAIRSTDGIKEMYKVGSRRLAEIELARLRRQMIRPMD
jgi:hypothetical protein